MGWRIHLWLDSTVLISELLLYIEKQRNPMYCRELRTLDLFNSLIISASSIYLLLHTWSNLYVIFFKFISLSLSLSLSHTHTHTHTLCEVESFVKYVFRDGSNSQVRQWSRRPGFNPTSLLNTQQYKIRIKGKVEQFTARSSALPYTSV